MAQTVASIDVGGTGLSTVGTSGYFLQSTGTGLQYAAVPATNPGGSNTQVQFNNSGAFGGSSNLTWSGTALSITGSLGVSGAITTTYPSISIQPATTTSQAYVSFVNANGTYYIGNDSSTASGFGTAGNYGSVWWRPASTALAISRSSTVDLYISSTGNVGIGTTSPAYSLDISGTGHVSTSFYIGPSVIGGTFQSVGGSGNTSHYFASYDSNKTGMTISNQPSNFRTLLASQWNSTATALAFGLASSEYMRVHTNGYIGIGNTSPSYPLDVGSTSSQTTTSGALGLIRNKAAADASPYTQSRIIVYGGSSVDVGNWGYLAYGADASMRIIYAKTGSGSTLYFGTSSAMDGTGSVTNNMGLDTSGNLSVAGTISNKTVAKAYGFINNQSGSAVTYNTFNVSSVTQTNTGRNTINWATAFADSNYIIVATANKGDSNYDMNGIVVTGTTTGVNQTTTQAFLGNGYSNVFQNSCQVCFVVFHP